MERSSHGCNGEPLGDAERRAMKVLEAELSKHAALTELIFNVIGMVLSRAPETPIRNVPQSRKVVTNLFIRLSNDLRSASLLALRGYPVQAASLVASIYEVAYTMVAIGRDNKIAQQWIDYDDPTQLFRKIKTLTRDGLAKLGVLNRCQADTEYCVYQQLCMAKHANPRFQRQHGYQLKNRNVVAVNGPDVSQAAIRAAWFALENSARLAFIALKSFVENYIAPEVPDDLMKQVKTIDAALNELKTAGIARYGNKDPLPGKA